MVLFMEVKLGTVTLRSFCRASGGWKTTSYRSEMACAVPLQLRDRTGNRQEEVAFRELCEKQGKDMGMQVAEVQRKCKWQRFRGKPAGCL